MSKQQTIDAFLKKNINHSELRTLVETIVNTSMADERPSKCSKIQFEEIDCDLELRE